jgi:hypothetical protein
VGTSSGWSPLHVFPTAANDQSALVSYLGDPGADAAPRIFGSMVLTLSADAIAAITWFVDTSAFRSAGLPDALPRHAQ